MIMNSNCYYQNNRFKIDKNKMQIWIRMNIRYDLKN